MDDFNDLSLYVLCGLLDQPGLHGIVSDVLREVPKHLDARPPLPSLDSERVLEGRIEHVLLIVAQLVLVPLAFLQMKRVYRLHCRPPGCSTGGPRTC